MMGYIEARLSCLLDEGIDPETLAAGAADTPMGLEVLCNFVRHFVAPSVRQAA